MGQYPTEAEVLTAVDQAGWLLEQQAARILGDHDFNPRPSWAFPDPDEPAISRELDVWSRRHYLTDAEAKLFISANVLVECKQSTNPYCAVGQVLPSWRQVGNPTQHTFPARFTPQAYHPDTNRLEYGYTWDVMGFRDLSLKHGLTNFRATQLTRLDRKGGGWSASNAGLFNELVYPLAKALRASQRHAKTKDDWDLQTRYLPGPAGDRLRASQVRRDYVWFTLRFPVVLISCPLYVVDASNAEPKFADAKWVRVQRHLDSSTLQGIFEFDVVTRDAFVEYVETVVDGFLTEFVEIVISDPLRYTGEFWIPPGTPEKSMGYSLPARELA